MDLGITNIFIFYLRSWLILFIVISQPSFDHRLTLAIYLTDSVWVNQYKRNREFWSIYSPKFHDTLHVSKNLTKDFVLLHPFQESHHSVLNPTNTPLCFLRDIISFFHYKYTFSTGVFFLDFWFRFFFSFFLIHAPAHQHVTPLAVVHSVPTIPCLLSFVLFFVFTPCIHFTNSIITIFLTPHVKST